MSTNSFHKYRRILLVSMTVFCLLVGMIVLSFFLLPSYETAVKRRIPELETHAGLTVERLGLTGKPIQQHTEIVLMPIEAILRPLDERPNSFVSLTYQLQQPYEGTIENIRNILLSDEAWEDVSKSDYSSLVYNYETGGWRYEEGSPKLNFRCAISLNGKTKEYTMSGIESSITFDQETGQIQLVLFIAPGDRYRCWLQNYN